MFGIFPFKKPKGWQDGVIDVAKLTISWSLLKPGDGYGGLLEYSLYFYIFWDFSMIKS